jgi:hypothetical protein
MTSYEGAGLGVKEKLPEMKSFEPDPNENKELVMKRRSLKNSWFKGYEIRTNWGSGVEQGEETH